MSTTTLENTEATILARVIAPESLVPPAVAAELLRWGFPESDKQRMSDLAGKARSGTLTHEEQLVLEGYERVSSFLGLVKSKARLSLRQANGE